MHRVRAAGNPVDVLKVLTEWLPSLNGYSPTSGTPNKKLTAERKRSGTHVARWDWCDVT